MKELIYGLVAASALAASYHFGGQHGELVGRAASLETIKTLNEEKAALAASNSTLLLGIAAQNQAVAVAEAQAEGAKAVQLEAQKRADQQKSASDKRIKTLEKALAEAETADDALNSYWEIRK